MGLEKEMGPITAHMQEWVTWQVGGGAKQASMGAY